MSAGANGYELVDSGGGSVQTADGTQVTFLADGMNGPIWVKLEALPSSAVKAGTGDDELAAAAEALPPDLTPALLSAATESRQYSPGAGAGHPPACDGGNLPNPGPVCLEWSKLGLAASPPTALQECD